MKSGVAASIDPDSAELPAGTVLCGRYRVERRIGAGGMAAVYLARHLRTDDEVAIKILHGDVAGNATAVERFRREARAPARIRSEHVVRVIDADLAPELGDCPVVVMEYLHGQDLDSVLDAQGPLAPAMVVAYLRQAAIGIDKAHAAGVIHRDLKPENLFVAVRDDGSTCIKILDFGIARLRELTNLAVTSAGEVFGTPLYMAPEQVLGDADRVAPQTDVWALGMLAYRMLTGREFWHLTSLGQLVTTVGYQPLPEAVTPYGAAFARWFATCCARQPDERFPSAGAAVAALAAALSVADEAPARLGTTTAPSAADIDPLARTRSDGGSTGSPVARSSLWMAAGVILALAAGGVTLAATSPAAVPAVAERTELSSIVGPPAELAAPILAVPARSDAVAIASPEASASAGPAAGAPVAPSRGKNPAPSAAPRPGASGSSAPPASSAPAVVQDPLSGRL